MIIKNLLGFFNLGATPLTHVASLKGLSTVTGLLATSWLHAPLEFFFVLVYVTEPLRLAVRGSQGDELVKFLRADLKLLVICLIGLLASAIEVFAGA